MSNDDQRFMPPGSALEASPQPYQSPPRVQPGANTGMNSETLAVYVKVLAAREDLRIIKWAAVVAAVSSVAICFTCWYWTLYAWSLESELEKKASEWKAGEPARERERAETMKRLQEESKRQADEVRKGFQKMLPR